MLKKCLEIENSVALLEMLHEAINNEGGQERHERW